MIEALNYQQYESESIRRSHEQLSKFVMNPAWDVMVAPFINDDELDKVNSTKRLEQLVMVSDANWDFRKGKERHEVEWDQGELNDPDSEIGQRIMAAGDGLGMIETVNAPAGHYDMAVVLGGGMRSILQRTEHLLRQEGVSYDRLVYLASTRPLKGAEPAAVKDFAPDAVTESDVARATVEHILASNGRQFTLSRIGYEAQDGHIGTDTICETEDGVKIHVLCAPAPNIEGRDRADTTDTYRLLRAFAANQLDEDARVLICTNSIYRFQEVDAEKELTDKTGAQVTMTVFSADSVGVRRLPVQILTEARSLINSMKNRNDEITAKVEDYQAKAESAQYFYETAQEFYGPHWRAVKRVAKLERQRRRADSALASDSDFNRTTSDNTTPGWNEE